MINRQTIQSARELRQGRLKLDDLLPLENT